MFVVVTVLGHVSWLFLAFLFRAITGDVDDEVAQPTSFARPQPPDRFADLAGYRRIVEKFFEDGWVKEQQRDEMHALGRKYGETLQRIVRSEAVKTAPESQPEGRETSAASAQQRPDEPAREDDSAVFVAALADETDAGVEGPPLSTTDPLAEPDFAAEPVAVSNGAAGQISSMPRRAASEVLQSFLIAHNIRWGELIAGLLIVVCAIGLVISLWSPLTQTHPLLPSLVFMAGTISIEAAGLYTLSRWRLRHTSRAVLLIATLLVPLSVVAGIAVARSGEGDIRLGNPLTIGFLLFGLVVYGVAIWRSGVALVRKQNAIWWTLAVAAPTAMLPLLPALARQFGMYAIGTVVFASVAVALAIIAPAGRRGLDSWRHRKGRPATRNLLWIAGVGIYSLIVLTGFLLSRGSWTLDVTVPVALSLLPAIVAATGLGFHIQETGRDASAPLIGSSLAMIGVLLAAATFPVSVARAEWLALWALAVAVSAIVCSLRLGTRWLVVLAPIAIGMAGVLLAPHWLDDSTWRVNFSLWRRPLQALSMLTAAGLGLVLSAVAFGLHRGEANVKRFALPITAASVWWLAFSMLTALFVGCFGWLIPGEVGWFTSAIILMAGGCFAITVAALKPSFADVSENEDRARTWSLSQWLLTIGQGALLLGAIVWIGWSIPERLFAVGSWKTGEAAWYWIGLGGGFALVWQGIARAARGRGTLGTLLDQTPIRLDDCSAIVASVGVIGCATLSLIRLLIGDQDASEWIVSTSYVAPLVAIGVTLAWLLVADRASASPWLRATVVDLRGLCLHASWLWCVIQLTTNRARGMEIAQPLSVALIWTGSAAFALLAICLAIAWWQRIQSRQVEAITASNPWGRFASVSTAWTAIVLSFVTARLVQMHWAVPGTDVTVTDRQAIAVVTVWMLLFAGGFAIAAVVACRAWAAQAAAVLLPLASLLIASVYADNGWQVAETVGLVSLAVVLLQRAVVLAGLLEWLSRYSVRQDDWEQPAQRERVNENSLWAAPVVGLAWLGIGIAAAFSLAAIVAAWFQHTDLDAIVGWTTLGLIGVSAGLVVWRRSALLLEQEVLPVHLLVLSAGILSALFVQVTDFPPSDAWRVIMVIWMAAAVFASGFGLRRGAASHRVTAVVLYAALACLGLVPRIFNDWTAWISLASAVIGHLTLMDWVRRWGDGKSPAIDSSEPRGTSNRSVAAQILAFGFAGIGFALLLGRVDTLVRPDVYQISAAAIWWIFWALVWRIAIPARQGGRLPFVDAVFSYISLLPLGILVAIGMAERSAGGEVWNAEQLAAGLACLVSVPLIGTTVLRMGHRGQFVVAYLATMATVAFLSSLFGTGVEAVIRVAVALISCAAVAVLMTWLWPMRRIVRAALRQRGVDWSDSHDQAAARELVFSLLATTVVTVGIAFGFALTVSEPLARWLAIASVAFCGWALAAISSGTAASHLRTVAVLVFCSALGLFAIAERDGETYRLLVTTMRLFVAGVFIVPACLWWVPRALRLSAEQWQTPLRVGAACGGGLVVLALSSMLVIEASLWDQVDIMSVEPVLVIGVGVVLVALSGMSAVMAVWPRAKLVQRILPNFSDGDRKALIYTAQVVAGLAWLHLYLCDATEFMDAFRGYWPYIVMALAFGSAAVTEWARRRGDRILSDTLRQTALFLPLIPAIGFWLSGNRMEEWAFVDGEVPYAMLLAVGAMFYLGLSMLWRHDHLPRLIGIVLGNAAVWVVLTQTPGWGFLQHPQLWLIPPAVCVLAAVHLERKRLDAKTRTGVRYAATLVIYVSSTADMLLQDIGSTIWGPIILVSLALLGVAVGMVMRVQAFLYLGTFFVLIGVLSMVWHAQQAIDQTWPWWVFGMTVGVLLLAGLMAIEKNKPKLREFSARLASWE
ncbi:MAG: hypothetical protein WD119_00370 [Pirellulaceae bacterium]